MQLFTEAVYRYHEQTRPTVENFFLPDEEEFLTSIGYTPHEMFDYVQEYATQGVPTPGTVLLIASVRRAYFMTIQRGMRGGATLLREADLPRETEEYQDIAYLPRIIRKAEAKLYGTLPQQVMYYCPKDRAFLQSHGNIHPADFLNMVWGAHGDKQKVVTHVLRIMKEASDLAARQATQAPPSAPEAADGEGSCKID